MTIFKENLQILIANPLSLLILLGGLILIVAIIKFKKININSKIMARIAIAITVATILNFIKSIFNIYHNFNFKYD